MRQWRRLKWRFRHQSLYLCIPLSRVCVSQSRSLLSHFPRKNPSSPPSPRGFSDPHLVIRGDGKQIPQRHAHFEEEVADVLEGEENGGSGQRWRGGEAAVQIAERRGIGEVATLASRLEPRSRDLVLPGERVHVQQAHFPRRQVLRDRWGLGGERW